MFTQNNQRITDLQSLNAALTRLPPPVPGINLSMLGTRGANLRMLDAAINADTTNLYNGIDYADLLNALKGQLAGLVNTHPIRYEYEDVHGKKHFMGGPPGTKFTQPKNMVNPELEKAIGAQLGRIRRDANGQRKIYYYTMPAQPYSGGLYVCIQLTYIPEEPERISYHGYPDEGVKMLALSGTKGGTPIQQQ